MIVAIFLLTVFFQISLVLIGGIWAGANLLFVFGVLLAIFRRSGAIPPEYYLLAAGLILDIISVSPLGVFALSFFTAFLIVRFILKFIHRETMIMTGGVVFFSSLSFRIIQQFLLVSHEFMARTIGSSVTSLRGGGFLETIQIAVHTETLSWIIFGAFIDVIVVEVVLGTLFIWRRFIFPMRYAVLGHNVSSSSHI